VNKKDDVESLCVIWENKSTGQKYRVGILSRAKGLGYRFSFLPDGLKDARDNGFCLELGFDMNKPYKPHYSKELFSAFKTRRPKGDSFDKLKADGGRVITDSISFEEATLEDLKALKIAREEKGSSGESIEM